MRCAKGGCNRFTVDGDFVCPRHRKWAQKWSPTKTFDSVVYFIHAPAAKRVKIGTTTNVGKRLAGIEAASPVPLKLLGSFMGGAQVERWCHFHCVDERSHFEWFRWNDRTKAFVDLVLAHGPDAASLLCVRELRSDQRLRQGRGTWGALRALPSRHSVRASGTRSKARAEYIDLASDDVTPLGQCTCEQCRPVVTVEGDR